MKLRFLVTLFFCLPALWALSDEVVEPEAPSTALSSGPEVRLFDLPPTELPQSEHVVLGHLLGTGVAHAVGLMSDVTTTATFDLGACRA